jgi:hypothetical protein
MLKKQLQREKKKDRGKEKSFVYDFSVGSWVTCGRFTHFTFN